MTLGMMMRRSHPLSLALLAAFAVSLSGCEMLSTSSTYEDAQRAFDAGQYRIANAHLSDVLANGEADARVRELQLELMLKLGDGNRAMAAIDQLSDSDLGEVERRTAVAHAQILQGRAEKTANFYYTVVPEELTEQDHRMWLWALKETGDKLAFNQRLNAALKRFPQSAHINALAADQMFDLRIPSEAGEFAKVAIENGPELLEARLVAGRQAIFAGDLEQAIGHYTKANEINPFNALPLTNVVGLHLDLGQVDEAGDALKIALENHGNYPFLQWQLARYKLASGDIQGAREAKDRVQRVYAENPEFILLMADIEAAFGNKGLALDNYRRFVREAGEVPEVMKKIAELES